MPRKHYLIGAAIIALSFAMQPLALVFTQDYVAPNLYKYMSKMQKKVATKALDALNINMDKLAACEQDPQIQASVEAQSKIGASLGVNGTPATFIGKKDAKGNIALYKDMVSGALPEASVLSAIQGTKGKQLTANVIINDGNLHIYGNPTAETFLVEFSDLQCPFCQRYHPTVKSIVDKSAGKIAFVYMHFPLPFHEKAMPLAITSECVYKQAGNDGFNTFIDTTFAGK